MAEDPEEIDRMIAADERLGRVQPREELTRRAKQGFPPDPKDEAKTTVPSTASGSASLEKHQPEEPGQSVPRTPRGAPDVAEQMPRAGNPRVLEPIVILCNIL